MIGGFNNNNNPNNKHPAVEGMSYPTQQGHQGTPRQAAMNQQNESGTKSHKLNHIVGGNGKIDVPQYQMQYTPTNGPESHPNNQITKNSETSTQGDQNAKYDHFATEGGSRSRRRRRRRRSLKNTKKPKKTRKSRKRVTRRKRRKIKGGKGKHSDWNWGCYS